MLPRPTLRKIVRETIAPDDVGEGAGVMIPVDEQAAWLADLASRLSQIDRVQAKVRDFYIALRIDSETGRRDVEWFMLNFFDRLLGNKNRSGLWLADATYKRRRKAETEVPIQSVAQIVAFIEAIKARQDRTRLRNQRTDKLNVLKQRGLEARLLELGQEHGFSFALGENKRDVNLSIRVGGKKSAYHIAFPKGKLDALLDQVPDFVRTLENLRELGVNFRTHNKNWQQGPWVEPKPSEE